MSLISRTLCLGLAISVAAYGCYTPCVLTHLLVGVFHTPQIQNRTIAVDAAVHWLDGPSHRRAVKSLSLVMSFWYSSQSRLTRPVSAPIMAAPTRSRLLANQLPRRALFASLAFAHPQPRYANERTPRGVSCMPYVGQSNKMGAAAHDPAREP